MYKKCWGCNRDNVPIFSWLAGNSTCGECKGKLFDPVVTENWKMNSEEYQRKVEERRGKVQQTDKKNDTLAKHTSSTVSLVFGVIALIYFVLMLLAQPDFDSIIIGWLVIGFIYLIVKVFD